MNKKLVLKYDKKYCDNVYKTNDEIFDKRLKMPGRFIISVSILLVVYFLLSLCPPVSFYRGVFLFTSIWLILVLEIIQLKKDADREIDLPDTLDNIYDLDELNKGIPNMFQEITDGRYLIATYGDFEEDSYSYIFLDQYLEKFFDCKISIPKAWESLNISVDNTGKADVYFS